MSEFRVSTQMYIPFVVDRRFDTSRVRRETDEWLDTFDMLADPSLRNRYTAIDSPALGAFACPSVPYDRCLYVAKWVSWLFVLDDLCDEDGIEQATGTGADEFFQSLIDAFNLKRIDAPIASPLHHSLADLRRGMDGYKGEIYVDRFRTILRKYFIALTWEESNRKRNTMPAFELYSVWRRHAGAIYLMFGLIDLSHDIEIPFPELDDGRLQSVRQSAATVIGWANDIMSFFREESAGDMHNVVLILEAERQLNRQEALRDAVDLHNREMERFVALHDATMARGSLVAQIYAAALVDWVVGSYDWAQTTARYHDTEFDRTGSIETVGNHIGFRQ